MSQLFIVLTLFLASVLGQAPQPDANCTAWLSSPTGQNFSQCENNFPGLPFKSPSNNCSITVTDYDTLCNDPCYPVMTQAYQFFMSTGTCLNLYNYLFGPCQNDTDCANPNLPNQICVQGSCYTSCTTDAQCNPCNSETCVPLGQVSGCKSNLTSSTGLSTFPGNVYQLEASCTKNPQGNYCALLFSNITGADLTNVQCSNFDSWGCCFGTELSSMQYCAFEQFTAQAIYQCSTANQTCSPLPNARTFCAVTNGTHNGTSSSSSTSGISGSSGSSGATGSSGSLTGSSGSLTGSSGSLTGSSGSKTGSMTGSSGSMTGSITGSSGSMTGSSGSMTGSVSGSMTGSSGSMTGSSGSLGSLTGPHGSTGVGTNSTGNSAGMIVVNWALMLGLVLIVPALS